MCGRFAQIALADFLKGFDLHDFSFDIGVHYNIAPTQDITVLIMRDRIIPETMRWGLIPSWSKDESIGSKMINARGETVTEKPSFRSALKKRRCIIPADGFYEWRQMTAGKQPYFIRLKSQETFCFAGLFESWQSPTGEKINTCTIITTTPNSVLEPIHNRMPVIIPKSQYGVWLNIETPTAVVLGLLVPYPSDEMEAYEVSTLVNSPKNDIPACIQPKQ